MICGPCCRPSRGRAYPIAIRRRRRGDAAQVAGFSEAADQIAADALAGGDGGGLYVRASGDLFVDERAERGAAAGVKQAHAGKFVVQVVTKRSYLAGGFRFDRLVCEFRREPRLDFDADGLGGFLGCPA